MPVAVEHSPNKISLGELSEKLQVKNTPPPSLSTDGGGAKEGPNRGDRRSS